MSVIKQPTSGAKQATETPKHAKAQHARHGAADVLLFGRCAAYLMDRDNVSKPHTQV